ncbi:hypothetical protein Xen7305DRAFT_00034300 [Xenococcus sp. PCC 7305]|uniref:hypothetical protein n=1 Tax=Xenococcus sp. PCC 7305 TaxID=102125 RepID=UPI0002ACD78A|nr:hypothetical protein [Xenococcus sp. PCC 7305]ELS03706.1 hypothetical protein Xen7305DRAFT_00034300 [Xenococcus sp. PCC 7305]
MNQPSSTTPLSFPKAIADTNALIAKIADNQLNETEIESGVTFFVKTLEGARGFFVAYLTGEFEVLDNPSTGVIKGLQSSPELVSDLLVKNLAMCTAVGLFHRRSGDLQGASGSDKVQDRTINLIQKLNSELVAQKLQELTATIDNQSDSYQRFLAGQKYDDEQKAEIKKIIALSNS